MSARADTAQPGAALAAFVRRARRRSLAMSALRTAGVAALAAAVTAAAIELDGGPSRELPAVLALLLAASFAGASWWREERADELDFARRIDRRLELNGALATAHEARGESGLATLLAQRTAARLGPDALRRAAPAPNLGWLAAPFAGLALWLAAHGASAPPASELAQLASSLATELAASGELDPAVSARLRESAVQLAESAARAHAAPAELPAQARALSEQVTQLARELAPSSERALELLAAAQRLDALAASGAGRPSADSASRGAAAGTDVQRGTSTSLHSEPGERTMMGSAAPVAGPSNPSDERPLPRASAGALPGDASWSPPALEAALLAGRWWSEDYDAVVAGWHAAR